MEQCDCHTLLRLPTGIFYAGGVKANVLFFDRRPPSASAWTKKLWICDLRSNQSFTSKTRTLKRSDLDDFVSSYNPSNRHERTETERFQAFSYEELTARDKASLGRAELHRQGPGLESTKLDARRLGWPQG